MSWIVIGLMIGIFLGLGYVMIRDKIISMRSLKRANEYTLTYARQREMNITAEHHHPAMSYHPGQDKEITIWTPEGVRPVTKYDQRLGATPGDEILKVDPKTWLREEDKRARREWDLEYLELTSGVADSRTLRIGVMQRLLRKEGVYNGPCDGKQTSEFTISLRRWTEQMWHAKTRTLANGATFTPNTLHPHDLQAKVTGVSGQAITFARGIVD